MKLSVVVSIVPVVVVMEMVIWCEPAANELMSFEYGMVPEI